MKRRGAAEAQRTQRLRRGEEGREKGLLASALRFLRVLCGSAVILSFSLATLICSPETNGQTAKPESAPAPMLTARRSASRDFRWAARSPGTRGRLTRA